MKIFPKFDRVLVKRESLKDASSVIIIPDQVDKQNRSERGEVVAVGPTAGMYDKDMEKVETIKVGAKVIFGKHAGAEIQMDKESYWIVQDTDILAEYEND